MSQRYLAILGCFESMPPCHTTSIAESDAILPQDVVGRRPSTSAKETLNALDDHTVVQRLRRPEKCTLLKSGRPEVGQTTGSRSVGANLPNKRFEGRCTRLRLT